MLEIGEHLDKCPACRREYAGLRETKHLLGALAMQTPREKFDAMLRDECEQAARPPAERLADWVMAWQGGAITLPRPRPLVAAAALSLGAILLATSNVGVPTEAPMVAASPEPAPIYSTVIHPDVYPATLTQPAPLILTSNTSVVWPMSAPEYPFALIQTGGTPRR